MDELGRPRHGGGVGEWGDDRDASLVEMALLFVLPVKLLTGTVTAAVAADAVTRFTTPHVEMAIDEPSPSHQNV